MEESTNISLEILLLNDLLHSEIIDKEIYNKAVLKIVSVGNRIPSNKKTVILDST